MNLNTSINTSMAVMNFQKAQDSKALTLYSSQAHTQEQEDKKLRGQTDNFEALLLKIMLQDAIKNDDTLYPKQAGSDIYHSMYIDELSQELSGSFGYSELLFNFLKEQQNLHKVSAKAKGMGNPYGQSK